MNPESHPCECFPIVLSLWALLFKHLPLCPGPLSGLGPLACFSSSTTPPCSACNSVTWHPFWRFGLAWPPLCSTWLWPKMQHFSCLPPSLQAVPELQVQSEPHLQLYCSLPGEKCLQGIMTSGETLSHCFGVWGHVLFISQALRLQLYQSASTAITKYHSLSGLYNRNLFLHSSESQKSKIQVPAGLPSPWLVDSCLPPGLHMVFPLRMYLS